MTSDEGASHPGGYLHLVVMKNFGLKAESGGNYVSISHPSKMVCVLQSLDRNQESSKENCIHEEKVEYV